MKSSPCGTRPLSPRCLDVQRCCRPPRPTPTRISSSRARRSSASTPSATSSSGPTSSGCTRWSSRRSIRPPRSRSGLKVDADALPPGTLEKADLKDPATTVALLKLNAVVGLKAEVDANNHITKLGVTCALCHSTVDDSVKPGIGKRLDGWPNRDLDVGAIIALSPALTADQKKVYTSWGPGKYDPRYNQDGKNTPLVLPPAYGLANVKNETYTAEGPISYWNAYVAVTQMGGQGNFSDDKLKIDVKHSPDMVTSKLPALRAYQHSLMAPNARAPRSSMRDGREARAGGVRQELRELPRRRQRHGQRLRQAAQAGRDRHGWRLRHAHQEQGLSHDAAARTRAAPAVLP